VSLTQTDDTLVMSAGIFKGMKAGDQRFAEILAQLA